MDRTNACWEKTQNKIDKSNLKCENSNGVSNHVLKLIKKVEEKYNLTRRLVFSLIKGSNCII